MIEIKLLNKKLLKEFIFSQEFKNLNSIPISIHRALSQIRNPRAGDNDILLLLAYEGSEMVGYLGVLPDYIYIKNTKEKIGWLSCIWVDNNHRGKNIAFKLVENSLEVWDNRILLTDYTAPAKRLYDKTKSFFEFQESKGIRLYLRSDLQTILPPKRQFFQKTIFLLKTFDFLFNLLFDIRFHFYKSKLNKYNIEYISEIDNDIKEFITDKQQKQLFSRKSIELNWIIKNPWIISASEKDRDSIRYHFSSIDKTFEFISLKIKNKENKLIAFLIFAKRNNSLKLPFIYYDTDPDIVIDIINYHLVKWKIKTFTIFNNNLVKNYKSHKSPALFKKTILKNYLISIKYQEELIGFDYKIQDGDGDSCFT